jgi:hypothetical protein
MKNTDQQWLDALAGQSSSEPRSQSEIEGAAVRNALSKRRNEIENDSMNFNSKGFDAIQNSLKNTGFLQDRKKTKIQSLNSLFFGASETSGNTISIQKIGVIAVVLLLVGLAIRVNYPGPKPDEKMLFRGNGTESYIYDNDPEKKSEELISSLEKINAEIIVENQSYGKVLIKIKSTEKIQEFLIEKRIMDFNVIDGYITLIITPPQVKKK